MKLEAGKCYRMRNGNKAFVAYVAEWNPLTALPVALRDLAATGFREGVNASQQWRLDGFWLSGGAVSDCDLVSEWREPRTVTKDIYLIKGFADSLHTITSDPASDPLQFGRGALLAKKTITITEGEGL